MKKSLDEFCYENHVSHYTYQKDPEGTYAARMMGQPVSWVYLSTLRFKPAGTPTQSYPHELVVTFRTSEIEGSLSPDDVAGVLGQYLNGCYLVITMKSRQQFDEKMKELGYDDNQIKHQFRRQSEMAKDLHDFFGREMYFKMLEEVNPLNLRKGYTHSALLYGIKPMLRSGPQGYEAFRPTTVDAPDVYGFTVGLTSSDT